MSSEILKYTDGPTQYIQVDGTGSKQIENLVSIYL